MSVNDIVRLLDTIADRGSDRLTFEGFRGKARVSKKSNLDRPLEEARMKGSDAETVTKSERRW